MPVRLLGHAVIRVRNQERAEWFYNTVLGLPIATRSKTRPMTFFTLGNHHDLAVVAVGDDAPLADPKGVGLAHLAFNAGETVDDLRTMKRRLEEHGITIDRVTDHGVTNSLYFSDPDGNGIELYVDTSDVWKKDPAAISGGKPLTL